MLGQSGQPAEEGCGSSLAYESFALTNMSLKARLGGTFLSLQHKEAEAGEW